ncbi:hypothetical protein J5N97_027400 [Dioscorea zingiberensis]|uniref:Bifunctional inhibitor/plant lipid transfer protein/seed storage helical domain-containing protein n=1 Tax=Dioscorea zingiberensis TaxID=325984 RepID=A0A9D5C4B1_9LILI|nr:hypothetical protein J5N97_027400 [Dioscorea zingiberensis]
MANSSSSCMLLLLLILLGLMTRSCLSDFASDRAECADKLIGLSGCLSYVGGSGGGGTLPTPECCSGFKQVVSMSLKCVCVLVKDRNEPQLGFKIDVQRALSLPTKCNSPANVSDCPRLLNLSPNSPQAKEFYQFANEIKNATSATSGNAKGKPMEATPSSVGWKKNWLGFGVEMNVGMWICSFVLLLLPTFILV